MSPAWKKRVRASPIKGVANRGMEAATWASNNLEGSDSTHHAEESLRCGSSDNKELRGRRDGVASGAESFAVLEISVANETDVGLRSRTG